MKQGDILTHPDGHTRKILGICGDAYLLSMVNNHETASYNKPYNVFPFYTIHDLTMLGYIIPKEQWTPEYKEEYWHLNHEIRPETLNFTGDFDKRLYDIGNCFKTEAEAQLAADKVKDLLKGL